MAEAGGSRRKQAEAGHEVGVAGFWWEQDETCETKLEMLCVWENTHRSIIMDGGRQAECTG